MLITIARCALRVAGEALLWLVGLAFVVALTTSCASVPPSKDRPQVACEFDALRRFRYALVTERTDEVTRWYRRQVMTSVRDRYDEDEHVTKTVLVRAGYCPDEAESFAASRAPETFNPPGH